MSSLFAQYIKERTKKEILESDIGFATYEFLQDGVYIEDIFVLPEHRQEGSASRLADIIAGIAKSKGFHKLYGTVAPQAKTSTDSLKVLLAYGFKLTKCEPNLIVMEKEI